MQTLVVWDRKFMDYIQASHRESSRPMILNKVRNVVYCLLLIHPHLNSWIVGTKRVFLKWKNSTIQKSAISLLQPFAH